MTDRQISPAGRKLIQQFESCAKLRGDGRYQAYPDPRTGGAPWTIGWGSTGADIGPATIWSKAQCDARFEADLEVFAKQVRILIGSAPTSQGQFDALVSLAYNVGTDSVAGSGLLRKHRAGAFAGARAEFGKWVYADHKRLGGLVRRRAAEAALYGS